MESEIETQSYTIKTIAFEGPLGLLLDLVEKRKLFINDVSLSQVTEDYLKYVNKLGSVNPNQASSFIVVAATLILIKSKSLLPNLELTSEEQGDINGLEERLRLYQNYVRLSQNIKNKFGKRIIFTPLERKNEILIFLPDSQITKESMMIFACSVLGSMPKKILLPEVEVKKVISIEEMIDKLIERIKSSIKINFREHFSGTKVEMIVGFLAMLELVRQGILDASQENDDIIIEKLEPNTYEPRN